MSAPATDLNAHLDLFLDLLADLNPYRFGEVPGSDNNPGTLPRQYVMVDVQRRYVPQTTLDADPVMSSWAVTVRGVGMDGYEAGWRMHEASVLLEAARVTVGGFESTPLEFEGDQPIRRDDERHWGDVSFTYVL